ncbi:5'-deoxynucleotidase [Gallaecimonas kandeliae]|uniref:5'-deoxynucleotidase n=1 Tax=Gallaecimonas kandeliae TaxID=3029055 RepID=UPI00264A3199|nr:5'-deoxynucleotidase [Gallaecimonas kandeliae]WKE67454.1 5'-deoxynucleotidase [Gallaecimonas kandeliae]
MLASHLFAHLARLRLIRRWPLMYNVQPENVAEHSLQVAMVAHALALIKNHCFGGKVDANQVATLALFHDASEVLTGDLPTPVKYYNPNIADEYKKIEAAAEQRLMAMAPDPLKPAYQGLFTSQPEDAEARALVKDADTLCAYLKCLQELNLGNHEFGPAKRRLEAMLANRMNDAIRYFLDEFVPSFSLSLDDINDDPEHNLVSPRQ